MVGRVVTNSEENGFSLSIINGFSFMVPTAPRELNNQLKQQQQNKTVNEMCFLYYSMGCRLGHFRPSESLWRIFRISWVDQVTNAEDLRRLKKEKVWNTIKIRKERYNLLQFNNARKNTRSKKPKIHLLAKQFKNLVELLKIRITMMMAKLVRRDSTWRRSRDYDD